MAGMAFNHENLKVYQRTLAFTAKVATWISEWDSRHAICDHLSRAAESMLENLAMASAAYSTMKVRGLEYAAGSALECAACLDLANIKRLLDTPTVCREKDELSQILSMLIGLRRAWSRPMVRETGEAYSVGTNASAAGGHAEARIFFHHESLDVYCAALQAMEVFSGAGVGDRLPASVFRRLDELLTSMVLNIAEGNGRFSAGDQCRFLGSAHESAIKTAARLDLCGVQELLLTADIERCKELLQRVARMTAAMIAGEADDKAHAKARDKGGRRT